jgi:hypothetical protein
MMSIGIARQQRTCGGSGVDPPPVPSSMSPHALAPSNDFELGGHRYFELSKPLLRPMSVRLLFLQDAARKVSSLRLRRTRRRRTPVHPVVTDSQLRRGNVLRGIGGPRSQAPAGRARRW